jgi:hypothetical protein
VTLRNLAPQQRKIFSTINSLLSTSVMNLPEAVTILHRAGISGSEATLRPHPKLHQCLDRIYMDHKVPDDVKKQIPAVHMRLIRLKDFTSARTELIKFLTYSGLWQYLCYLT